MKRAREKKIDAGRVIPPETNTEFASNWSKPNSDRLSTLRSSSSTSEKLNHPVNGKIVVIVLKGINLRKVTQFKTQDPYVKLQASGSRKAVATNF